MYSGLGSSSSSMQRVFPVLFGVTVVEPAKQGGGRLGLGYGFGWWEKIREGDFFAGGQVLGL